MTETQPSPTPELDADRTRILTRLVEISARVADLNSEAEGLKAELRSMPAGEYAVNGRPALRIIPTRRFDATTAALSLPEELRTQCLAISYDAAKVKEHLTPAQVEQFMVEAGKPKVTPL